MALTFGIHVPGSYQSHESGMALVFEATAKQVSFIAINPESHAWDIQYARINDFHSTYKHKNNYSAAKFAQKALAGLIPPAKRAEQILKEIIMSTATVIAVNQDRTFAGRFADHATAAAACPEATLVTSAEELLEAGLADSAEEAGEMFAQYAAQEATVKAGKGRKPKAEKAPKEPKVKEPTALGIALFTPARETVADTKKKGTALSVFEAVYAAPEGISIDQLVEKLPGVKRAYIALCLKDGIGQGHVNCDNGDITSRKSGMAEKAAERKAAAEEAKAKKEAEKAEKRAAREAEKAAAKEAAEKAKQEAAEKPADSTDAPADKPKGKGKK